jgi:hypothetical protein
MTITYNTLAGREVTTNIGFLKMKEMDAIATDILGRCRGHRRNQKPKSGV